MKDDVQRVPPKKYRVMTNAEAARKIADDMEAVLNEDVSASTHGITCLEYKVLVRPLDAVTKTPGGIVLPEIVVERDQNASMEGEVTGISPLAFSYESNAPKPAVGDVVVFQRFAGIRVKGNDGVEYRLMNDKDVVAVRRRA